MSNKYLLFAFFLAIFRFELYSQSVTCENSEPFCTGNIYTFMAGTTGNAQPGPYYGCLASQPGPGWFHMLVENPGSITIHMYMNPSEDIDFICWGPFADPVSPCEDSLVQNKIVDCDYSPDEDEYCVIPDAQPGQYYILLITNYSLQPGHISFIQNVGTGSLDCSVIDSLKADFTADPLIGVVPLEVSFTDTSEGVPVSYRWDFQNDGNYEGYVKDPAFTYTQPGTYSVKLLIQKPGQKDSIIKYDYIKVLGTDLPDLQVSGQYINPVYTQPGGNIYASVRVENQGITSSDSCYLKYYLSYDSLFSAEEDLELGSSMVKRLNPGQSGTYGRSLTIPPDTPTGYAYILFYADADGQVFETNEGNNIAFSPLFLSPAGLNEQVENQKILIYPNPAHDQLFIDFSGMKNLPFSVDLLDLLGKCVFNYNSGQLLQDIIKIDVSSFNSGIYILKMNTDEGCFYKKIIVEK